MTNRILLVGLYCLGAMEALAADIQPVRLQTEWLENPQAIHEPKPLLSWELKATDPETLGLKQSAYEILVASTPELLAQDKGDLWSSGKVISEETLAIEYNGKSLGSRQDAFWKVRSWDQNGEVSAWSVPAHWRMGLLRAKDWEGQPITWDLKTHEPNQGYLSLPVKNGETPGSITLDFGEVREIDELRLYAIDPFEELPIGYLFPKQFRIEAATKADFSDAKCVVDRTTTDFPNPVFDYESFIETTTWKTHPNSDAATRLKQWIANRPDEYRDPATHPAVFGFDPVRALYVRLTVTKAAPILFRKKLRPARPGYYAFALSEIEAARDGKTLVGTLVATENSVETLAPELARGFSFSKSNGWRPGFLCDGRVRGSKGTPGRYVEQSANPQFRKEFTMRQGVKRATWYVLTAGAIQLSVNGARVGEYPSVSRKRIGKKLAYQAIDVTAHLRDGANALGAIPAAGWFARSSYNADTPGPGPFYGPAYLVAFQAQLDIEYADGTSETVTTDESWKYDEDGPWRWAELCQGVTYDFRKVIPGWNEPGFEDNAWKAAKASGVPRDLEITGMAWAPYGVIGEFEAVNITEPKPGVFVVDFGRVLGGFPKLTVQGTAGQVVRTTPGHMLNSDGSVNTIAYKFARNSCEMILDGKGQNTLEPDFTYHSFRYIQIEGLESRDQLIGITGIHASNRHRQTLEFSSSEPLLDKLVKMHRVTFQVNNQSFLTDVADRDERGEYFFSAEQGAGWFFLEDAGAIQRRTAHSQSESFTPETGLVSNLAAGQPARVAMAGFTDGILEMPLQLLEFYNDRRTLERAYEPAAQTFRTLIEANLDGLAKNKFSAFANNWSGGDKTMRFDGKSFVDRSERTDDVVFQTAWLYRSLKHLEQIAGWLGKPGDAEFFKEAARLSADAFARELAAEDGKVRGGTQVGHSIALWSGILDEHAELKQKVVTQLLRELERMDNHLTAGGYGGVTSLFDALSDNGHHDLALRVMLRPDYPSYGFMARHTGGGVWENFDSWHDQFGFNTKAMNSQCHPDQATILPWIIHRLAGIRPGHGPEAGGFKHFEIRPQLVDGLDRVDCRFHSARGPIVVSYKKASQTFEMTVEIPPNTSAAVTLLDGTRHEVESGQYQFNMSRDTE